MLKMNKDKSKIHCFISQRDVNKTEKVHIMVEYSVCVLRSGPYYFLTELWQCHFKYNIHSLRQSV